MLLLLWKKGEERESEEEKEGEEKGKERKEEGEKKERRRREKENMGFEPTWSNLHIMPPASQIEKCKKPCEKN